MTDTEYDTSNEKKEGEYLGLEYTRWVGGSPLRVPSLTDFPTNTYVRSALKSALEGEIEENDDQSGS